MRCILGVLLLLVSSSITAQLPKDFRSEQIYLNLHQTACLPGDTLLLEGQVTCLAKGRFLPYSNYLYIECFNEQDSVLVRQKVSCKENGYFSTYLPTDYEWLAGVYYLRAYTRLMRNFSPESFAQQSFLLGKEFPKKGKQVYEARCTIVPSGGKMVFGYPQTVAVYLTDECSFPVSAKLQLMSEKGDTISFIQTSTSGMAQLRFIPAKDLSYYLTGNIDGRDYHFPLPDATQDVKVQGSLNGKRLNYQILNAREKRYNIYVYDRLNGLNGITIERNHGILMLDETPETVTLFLTDANNNVLSEQTIGYKQERKGKIQAPNIVKLNDILRHELPQFPSGSRMMVRVVAENDLLATSGEKSLKYLSDYSSSLPFPRHLYAADEAEFNNDLNTWLSTVRFHRFDLKEALAKDTAMYVHSPEQVLYFSGKIEKKNGRPMKDGQLIAYHTSKDFVYDTSLTGDSARFLMAIDDFIEGEEFFLQAITPKGKADFANYLVDEETYPALQNNRRFHLPFSRYADSEVIVGNDFNLNYVVDKNNERNYTLPNVTVKARLRTEKVKDTYEFYSNNYADREEIEERGFLTLADILRSMTGISVGKHLITVVDPTGTFAHEEWKWIVRSTRGTSTLSGSVMPIILDGFREDNYDFVMEYPASEIESVQLLRAWQALAYASGAIDGAILVKTKNGKGKYTLPSKGAMYAPMGLSPLSYPYSEAISSSSLVCTKSGNYRLIIDVFTSMGVQSFEHRFNVRE